MKLVRHIPADENSLDQQVGSKVKELRLERNWSLADASRETGLSTSALSRIERGELSPTLGSLSKISQGFGMELTTLLDGAGRETARFRRAIARDGEGLRQKTSTCRNTYLMQEIREKRMQPIRTRVVARSPADYRDWEDYSGEVFVFVLSGALILCNEYYEDVRLCAGDSTYYDVSLGIKWYSEGPDDADILWVYTR